MSSILVAGIATADAIARTVERFPSPGGLQFFDDLTFCTGGCAVNCSIALARLGVSCDLITRVGTDALGDFVVSELERNGVPTAGVLRDPAASTPFTFVAVLPGGERSFLHTKGTNARIQPTDIPDAALRHRRIFFLTGCMLMDALDGPPAADRLARARAAGALTLLDTVYDESASQPEWECRLGPALPHLDYFLPSYPEARALAGVSEPADIAKWCAGRGVRNVIIKLDERGAFCRTHAGDERIVPAFHVPRVVDATGAGDCWCAGFIAGISEGMPFEQAVRWGNAVAAHAIQAAGATAGVPRLDEIKRFVRSN